MSEFREVTFGEHLFSKIDENAYLNKLYHNILWNYSRRLFQLNEKEEKPVDIDDALTFADILSKSYGTSLADVHKTRAQEIAALLYEMNRDNEDVKYVLGSVLTNTGNFLGFNKYTPEYRGATVLERLFAHFNMEYLTIALPKGKLFGLSADLLAKIGYTAEDLSEKSRKLIITNEEKKIRFIISKTADVPTYVEYGAADIGVIGKDVLLESGKDVYELLDLGFGKCHLMMAVDKNNKRAKLSDYAHTRVATKFPHIAEKFFNSKGMQMEFIKLNGSIELGPIVGLSESIVDIVETGTTLRENNLEEIAFIMDATARLICNRVSFKLKFDRIHQLTEDLRKILEMAK